MKSEEESILIESYRNWVSVGDSGIAKAKRLDISGLNSAESLEKRVATLEKNQKLLLGWFENFSGIVTHTGMYGRTIMEHLVLNEPVDEKATDSNSNI